MRKKGSTSFDWVFWFLWIMATAWGWVFGWILGSYLISGIALVATGIAIGALQWLVLKQRMIRSRRWIPATAAGWAVGWAIAFVAVPAELGFLYGLALGAATGITQWLVLRREVHWAAWWVLISALAWTLALGPLSREPVVGVTPGALTGVALELLLRNPRPGEMPVGQD
jgi:hypothetical protein